TMDMLVLMPLTMVLVNIGQGNKSNWRQALGSAVGGLFTNPMVLGILFGVVISAVGMPMPVALRTFTALLGAAAGPCALFAIGATLAGQRAGQDRPSTAALMEDTVPQVALMSGFKLVVHPLLMWTVMAGIFTLDPLWVSVAILAAALPIASTVYVVAGRYRTYLQQVSAAILVSTVASVVTVSIVLTLLFGNG
ncbi:MAG TPA: AEC family transporter, partial [bacterium]